MYGVDKLKNAFVNSSLNIITNSKECDEIEIKKLKYGLEGLYSFITKFSVILIINMILGTTKEFILFHFSYALVRAFGFGIHAKTNIGCWITSSIVNIFIPQLIKRVIIDKYILIITGIISSIIIIIFAPADTKKRPLKNKHKRKQDKVLAIIVCITYLVIINYSNHYIIYCLTYALVFEAIMVNPITYIITKQSYNNYKKLNV